MAQATNTTSVTIKIAPHPANPISSAPNVETKPCPSTEHLLRTSCRKQFKSILQSSFASKLKDPDRGPIHATSNGFVHSVITAYNNHHHLILRPEDIWFAILTQFSCYVNAHAEDLRGKFVSHEGQKELLVEMPEPYDFSHFAAAMGGVMQANIVDPELRNWILPSFSTTTSEDTVVASILMMGTLQKFFTYMAQVMCGIPSVTLLGNVSDWEDILSRVEKLEMYGEEAKVWLGLLRPVLRRFVLSVRKPNSKQMLDFWQRVVHKQRGGSGKHVLTGWFTAFCFWNEEGKCTYQDPLTLKKWNVDPRNDLTIDDKQEEGDEEIGVQSEKESDKRDEKGMLKGWSDDCTGRTWLVMDGARYGTIDIKFIPKGYGSVPVKVKGLGGERDTTMVAGSVGIRGTSSGNVLEHGEVGLDTMQPVTGWWIYENESGR